jgi:hypothetical protein
VTDVPEAEDIPGTLIVRIRESLDFGARAKSSQEYIVTDLHY